MQMPKKYEKTVEGFFTPKIMRRLVPIPGLLERERIDLMLADPDHALSVINEEYTEIAEDYRGNPAMGLDPHEALLSLLEMDRPLEPVKFMLEDIGAAQPAEDPVLSRKEALSHICAQTAARCGTLAALPACSLIRSGGKFRLVVNGSLFKNRKAERFARGKVYEKELENLAGCYEALEHYIDYGRRAVGMADHPKLFVTKGGAMSEAQVYNDVFGMTRRFLSEQGQEGRNLPGLLPFGPGGYRHIVATHMLKTTRNLLVAAEAIHDDPKTVFEHYARYAPEDLRVDLELQWRTLRGEEMT
jgi:hypothetical protein